MSGSITTPHSEGPLTLDSVVVAAGDQSSASLPDEILILSLSSGSYYGLRHVGARLWELVATPRPVRELCATLMDEYDVSFERCRADLLALLGRLADRRLIEVRDGTAAPLH